MNPWTGWRRGGKVSLVTSLVLGVLLVVVVPLLVASVQFYLHRRWRAQEREQVLRLMEKVRALHADLEQMPGEELQSLRQQLKTIADEADALEERAQYRKLVLLGSIGKHGSLLDQLLDQLKKQREHDAASSESTTEAST
jgi:hypothetical protein